LDYGQKDTQSSVFERKIAIHCPHVDYFDGVYKKLTFLQSFFSARCNLDHFATLHLNPVEILADELLVAVVADAVVDDTAVAAEEHPGCVVAVALAPTSSAEELAAVAAVCVEYAEAAVDTVAVDTAAVDAVAVVVVVVVVVVAGTLFPGHGSAVVARTAYVAWE
jgi:hypothetical protein